MMKEDWTPIDFGQTEDTTKNIIKVWMVIKESEVKDVKIEHIHSLLQCATPPTEFSNE